MSETYANEDVVRRYDSARSLPEGTAELCMRKVRGLLPEKSVQRVLDLGCGTGRFLPALLTIFQCPVMALDPSAASAAMLRQGRRRELEGITWLCCTAEQIPLREGTADLGWMCQVFHHLDAPQEALLEVRRTLSPKGCLVVRNGTQENDQKIEWSTCFPEAREMDRTRLPSQDELVRTINECGFDVLKKETFYQYFASSYREYYVKLAERGLSSLIAITDDAFASGLDRLRSWVAQKPADEPVYEPVDMFVFQVKK